MMRNRRHLIVPSSLILSLFAYACMTASDGRSSPVLEASEDAYTVTDSTEELHIRFTIENVTSDTVILPTCSGKPGVYLQVDLEGSWRTAFTGVCGDPGGMEQITLPPLAAAQYTITVPLSSDPNLFTKLDPALLPGRFRLASYLKGEDGATPNYDAPPSLTSNPFTIEIERSPGALSEESLLPDPSHSSQRGMGPTKAAPPK